MNKQDYKDYNSFLDTLTHDEIEILYAVYRRHLSGVEKVKQYLIMLKLMSHGAVGKVKDMYDEGHGFDNVMGE